MRFKVGGAVTAVSMLLLPLAASPAWAQDQSSWGGWYVGGNAGGSWGDIKLSRQVTAGAGNFVIPPADVALINSGNSSGSNKSGFTGGIEGGYNYMMDSNWLFGIEGEWVALSVNNRATNNFVSAIQPLIAGQSPTTYTVTQRADTDWMVDFRPRIGYASGPWLFFGSAGIAFADVKSNLQLSATTTPPQSLSTEKSSTRTGWIAGLGAGYAVSPQWSIKGEWLYADFGTTRTTATSASGFASLTSAAEVRTNILRIGADYRF